MARCLLRLFSEEDDLVCDPFSGRGTTLLEARLLGRTPVASDMNPLAVALTRAKNVRVTRADVMHRIDALDESYDRVLYAAAAQAQGDNIQLIYHPDTLAHLCYLRSRLVGSRRAVDQFLVGVVLGVMHGGERQDGGSAYASISMPNTFSMSPDYVRRFVQEKQLNRVHRDVFQLLREKTDRLFAAPAPHGPGGVVARADAKRISSARSLKRFQGRIRLILTSPPYLNVVNYALQNWIRLWFLGDEATDIDTALDDHLTLGPWLEVMDGVLAGFDQLLADDGCIVLVIGDVAKSATSVLSPARELIRRVLHNGAFDYVGCATDRLNTDEKVSRIWRTTRGRATAIDRVVVLGRAEPRFRPFQDSDVGISEASVRELRPNRLAEYARGYAGV